MSRRGARPPARWFAKAGVLAGVLACLLVSGHALRAQQNQPGTSQTFEGILGIVWGDPHPSSGSTGDIRYTLTLPDGQMRPLQLTGQENEAAFYYGKRVLVTGTQTQAFGAAGAPATAPIVVGALAPSPVPQAFAAEASVLGTRRVIFLLVKFSDDASVPHPPSFFTDMTNPDTPPGGATFPSTINGFFKKTSYNQFSWIADVGGVGGVGASGGWLTLPFPRSHYAPCNSSSSCAAANLSALGDDATALGRAQGIDFRVYNNINFVLSNDLDCCAWGGGYFSSVDGQSYGATWEPPWGQNVPTYGHEMGHSLGLPHSGWLYYSYDSPWDVMSSVSSINAVNCGSYISAQGFGNALFCSEPGDGYIAPHRDFLGWIPSANQVVTDTSTGRTVTLEAGTLPLGSLAKSIKVCITGSPCTGSTAHFYTIEARVKGLGATSQYDNGIPGDGVIIHDVQMNRPAIGGGCYFNTQSGWAVPTDATPGDYNSSTCTSTGALSNAQWTAGQTYTNGFSIKVISRSGSTFAIWVTPQATAPIALTSAATGVSGSAATFNGTANPNGFATNAYFEYGLTTGYGSTTSVQAMGSGSAAAAIGGGAVGGLVCASTYHFRATATNANGTTVGEDATFTTPACTPPSVTTGVATLIGLTGSTLNALANPNGLAATASFEYGLTTGYGSTTAPQSIGSGSSTVEISTAVAGLSCNTPYHFRAVATGTGGSAAGTDALFTTPPCTPGMFRGFVYALDQINGVSNLVFGFGVTPSGTLVQIPGFPIPTGGSGGSTAAAEQLVYDAANARLYAVNDGSDSLSAFSVSRLTGALTSMPFSPIALGAGSWTTAQVHPSGSPVIVSEASGSVASFAVNASTATPAAGSPYSAGLAVYSGAFSRDGNYLYVGGGGATTAGFSVSSGTGVLTPIAGSPFTLGGAYPVGYATDSAGRVFSAASLAGNQVRVSTPYSGALYTVYGNPFSSGLSSASSGVVHPSGFYLVADPAGSRIGVYQVAGSSSSTTLAAVAGSPFSSGGTSTNALALSKDGGLLFAANGSSRNLTVFSVSPATGALTAPSTQPANALGSAGIVTGVAFAASRPPFGDLDGDGKSDILLRNRSTGQDIGWLMNGTTIRNSAFMPTLADTNWEIVGRGDFDGDGKADVVLRNKGTGQDVGWLMNGLTVVNSAFLPTLADTNWEIRGVGDFDGDGKADVILRNKGTGQDVGWLMNGLTIVNSAFMPTLADTNWEIKGVGDFNGDGKADVVLRNKGTGQNVAWLMNGLTVANSAFLPTLADTNWEIKGVGDLDGDGKADVILRNKSTGQYVGWLMNGLTVANSAVITTIADTNWDVRAVGDYDGDGKADIIIHNTVTGQNAEWLMNGLAIATSTALPTIADVNWDLVGQGQ